MAFSTAKSYVGPRRYYFSDVYSTLHWAVNTYMRLLGLYMNTTTSIWFSPLQPWRLARLLSGTSGPFSVIVPERNACAIGLASPHVVAHVHLFLQKHSMALA